MKNKFTPKNLELNQATMIPNYYEFGSIASVLKRGSNVNRRDLKNFKEYERGKSLDITLIEFMENHETQNIDKDLFKRWLNSLGWQQ